jgi:hypothetical protein
VSTIFLDIKGGFDHVDHRKLIQRLTENGVPEYMTMWIQQFITSRECALVFPGSARKMETVNTGIPQE